MFVPLTLTIIAALMIAIERIWPGRALPKVKGWFGRVLSVDAIQILVVLAFGKWAEPLIVQLRPWDASSLGVLGGTAVGYLAITFVYYWWHRWRHEVPVLWRTLHQLHHSPTRMEIVTSFYKHPLEILSNATLSAGLLYIGLGLNPEQVAGTVIVSAVAELFYHWNIRTPHWVGYFIQRPEMHRLHHGEGLHAFNYGDLPIWDMLFGTYRNPRTYDAPCGYPEAEHRLWEMLCAQDVVPPHTVSPHTNSAVSLREAFTPNVRAYLLLGLGTLSMAGGALSSSELTGLGLITGAAPYPKVFTTREGLEGFSSTFNVSWVDADACFDEQLTPYVYSQLEGPYNRRNVYGAAMAGGPFLASDPSTKPMLDAVSQWSFCEFGLLEDLGLANQADDIVLTVTPREGAHETSLPLTWEITCS